jgi:transposase-like protein/IS1 family transposase
VVCHRCQTEAFKFGVQNGYQRYRCKTCKKTFSDIPSRPLDNLRIEPEKAHLIVRLLCEGNGIRACERLAGVNRRTVLNVLSVAAHKAQQLMNEKVRNIEAKHVSIDEIHSFVGCLPDNNLNEDDERGAQFIYLAIEQGTKMILHWHTGKRNDDSTDKFLNGLRARTTGRFQLTSDAYTSYTNGRGIKRVFQDSVDYGTETKTFGAIRPRKAGEAYVRRLNPVVCTSVRRKVQFGNPDRDWMTTNHSERCNLSMRIFNRRLTRKTMGFSRKLENHRAAVTLQVAHFNFCRTHSALKIQATDTTPSKEQTPAMAQGVVDRIFSIADLLGGI